MSLNERKINILHAIINDYIMTAEPVGSRTIAKKYNLGISSATIRNEMSDLEEMGFIIQPHASAGRIPSDLGYRLYVDQLMPSRELSEQDQQFLQQVVVSNVSHIDYLMEETAKALSMLTNYTAIISEPPMKQIALKQVRLLPIDESNIMLVIVTEENFIKNHVIYVEHSPEEDEIYRISNHINHLLKGRNLQDIDDSVIQMLKKEFCGNESIVGPLLNAIESTIRSADNVQIHLSGTKNILSCPEFSDIQKAKTLFQTLEEKDVLITLLGDELDENVQILIGNENSIEEMKHCSVIRASYCLGGSTKGSIGILGPTRMDYSQVVSTLNSMIKNIEKVLKALTNEKRKS